MRTYIFGPVPSRRLGMSLGVDLTPNKTCTFDCIYCQLAKTCHLTSKRTSFCPPDDVLAELEMVLSEVAPPDWITISGTGEPTLNSDLGYVLGKIKTLTKIPTCVITNSSLFSDFSVQNDLLLADCILPTLTTTNHNTYCDIHRHVEGIILDDVLSSFREFTTKYKGKIEIEIFVCPTFNDSDHEIASLRNYILTLTSIDSIYLNTAVRVPLEKNAITATQESLEKFRNKLNLSIPISTAFEKKAPIRKKRPVPAGKSEVIKLLMRHPTNQEFLTAALDIPENDIAKILNLLCSDNIISQKPNGDWYLKTQ